MQFTAIDLGFGALAAAVAALVAHVLRSEGLPESIESYTLHVAFTPWGPDVLHWWVPTSSALSAIDVKKGDLL